MVIHLIYYNNIRLTKFANDYVIIFAEIFVNYANNDYLCIQIDDNFI